MWLAIGPEYTFALAVCALLFYVFLLYKINECFRFVSLEKTSVTNVIIFISKGCEMNTAFSAKAETNDDLI